MQRTAFFGAFLGRVARDCDCRRAEKGVRFPHTLRIDRKMQSSCEKIKNPIKLIAPVARGATTKEAVLVIGLMNTVACSMGRTTHYSIRHFLARL